MGRGGRGLFGFTAILAAACKGLRGLGHCQRVGDAPRWPPIAGLVHPRPPPTPSPPQFINFRVAKFKQGELCTDTKQLARDYFKLLFWVDFLSGGWGWGVGGDCLRGLSWIDLPSGGGVRQGEEVLVRGAGAHRGGLSPRQACSTPTHPTPTPPHPAVIPFDEIALAIAGLNGTKYIDNPQLAYYLGLLRLVALVGGGRG